MNRFQFVTAHAAAPERVPLADIAHAFAGAVACTEQEGHAATDDPAVLVLGAWIAFRTHADVNTVGGYRQLLDLCREGAELSPIPQ